MIPQTTVLFGGVLAVIASAGAMSARFDVPTRIVFAVAGMFAWGLYSFGMLDLGVATGAGGFESFRVVSHAIVAALFGLIMLLFALDNVRDLL